MAKPKTQAKMNEEQIDIDSLAEAAVETKGFLPILDFGKKTEPWEGVVVFDESRPHETDRTFEDDDGDHKRLVINVSVRRKLPDGSLGPADARAIMFRGQPYADGKLHSLTNGILALWRENGKDLKGVEATITKRTYDHPKRGASCAYDVRAVHSD